MNNKDLIKQYVTTSGLSIPEHQFNQLNNNLKGSYLRKRIQAAETNQQYYYLKNYELLALPIDVRSDYINKLDSDGIEYLLNKSKEPDKLINIFGQKGIDYINKLDSDGIYHLLSYSSEPDKLINILLSTEGFINKLDSDGIRHLLNNSSVPDKLINILLSTEGFINNLDSDGIYSLLYNSKEPDKIRAILSKYGKP